MAKKKAAPAKKAPAKAAAPKPIKEALNKSGLVAHIAETSAVAAKDVRAVLAALEGEDFMFLDRREAPRATRAQLALAHPLAYVDAMLAAIPSDGLSPIDADTIAVDANIVDPSVRGTWANVWLKLEATRGAMRLGIKNFQFTTFDHYADTRSFTKKLGGTTIHSSLLMYRPL